MPLPPPLMRFLGALPDAAMAAAFLAVWIAPHWLGEAAVRTGLLVMLVEFVLVHATAMIGMVVLSGHASPGRKRGTIAGFGALYLVFIAAFSLQFQSWWPLLALAWLLLSKALMTFGGGSTFDQRHRMQSAWVVSVMAYLVAVTVTVLLPMPRLGLTREVVAGLDIPGDGGLWNAQPHTVLAFGTLYFLALAITKAFDLRLPASTLPGLREH